jgi:hypothetical protein
MRLPAELFVLTMTRRPDGKRQRTEPGASRGLSTRLRRGAPHLDAEVRTLREEVRALREEVRALREAQRQANLAIADLNEDKSRTRKYVENKGARPEVYPDADFFLEMVRFEYLDEGIQSRHQLTKYMLEWSAKKYSPPPDLRTVQRKVAKAAKVLNLR